MRGGGLTRRVLIASLLLALIIGGAFAMVVRAIDLQRQSAQLAADSQQALATASQLEGLVIDIESSMRGYLLTGDETFLEPWTRAQANVPQAEDDLQGVARLNQPQVTAIRQDITSYINNYSIPVVNAARQHKAWATSIATTADGERRINAIRAEFATFASNKHALAVARHQRALAMANQAITAGAIGVAGSIMLVAVFAGYLTRVIVRPVRRAAVMADRVAGGDLSARIAETGAGEIRTLVHSFNMMGHSLEQSRDELARLAGEQSALRRVATLVAHGEPPGNVFAVVAEEAGRVLGVDGTRLLRYEADGTATVVTSWGDVGSEIPVGTRVTLDSHDVAAAVLRTHQAARIEDPAGALGEGVHSAVGAPILVEGNLWGVMKALTTRAEPIPEDIEARLTDFTDLIATAIANTQARADLAASRARVVAAGDEIRRRIERNLHDGTQQRLVSLALDLRTVEASLPTDLPELQAQLSEVASGLASALEELRETARGIHPAILSEGGLGPALKALARRSALPVDSDVNLPGRLPEPVEAAAYYIVAEALTNAAKYAQASAVRVEAAVREGRLHVSIQDDGIGGADPTRGSGLIGLRDRAEALGGTITVASRPHQGTVLRVELPLNSVGVKADLERSPTGANAFPLAGTSHCQQAASPDGCSL